MPGQTAGRDMSESFGFRDDSSAAAAAAAAAEDKGLDQQLWQACAGSMVQLPGVGSKIIYFPQGHGEQASSLPDFPRSLGPVGAVPCRVLSVRFLADKETDEVFSRIRLQPEGTFGEVDENDPPAASIEKPAAFAKTLTQSDANNGGGFSVPRYCAETIFPKLDYSADPPVQTVFAKDVHGDVWKFRHIYRGTPRRHLLTTGWSTFVNQKKLVAGDAIVFLRTSSGELCVGVRRSMRGATSGDALLWHSAASVGGLRPSRWEVRPPESNNYSEDTLSNGSSKSSSGGSFARNRSRVTAKSVLDSATLAASGKPFEVVYYPRASTAEFCVKATTVKAALSHPWYAGMRFKMAFETEDSSRISWFMGTVSAVQAADPVLWPSSPWRVLQVAWDEPDLLQGVSRISPWQVELVSTVPMQLPPTPFSLPKKKFRASQPFTAQEGHGFTALPATTLGGGGVLGQVNSWHGLSDEVPASMQGARHERLYGLTFSDCQPNKLQAGLLDKLHPQDQAAMLSFGGQELRLGNVFLHDRGEAHRNLSNVTPTLGRCSQNSSATSVNTGSSNRQQHQQHHQLQQHQQQQQQVQHKQAGTILLFGKTINTASNIQEQQNSGGSSSEGTSQPSFQNNGSPTTTNNVSNLSASSSGGEASVQQQQHYHHNGGDNNGSLKWLKEQASVLSSEKKDKLEGGNNSNSSGSDVQCKIFLESEEVGRTLDLSQFSSYEELYTQVAKMFGMDRLTLSGRVVYKDSEGSTIHVGGEPYVNFVKSVKRLTILSDTRMLQ